MGLSFSTIVTGAREKISKLRAVEKEASIELTSGVEATLHQIVDYVKVYPPETEANSPPPYPYWSRGIGNVYFSGKVDPTSQHYGDSWDIFVKKGEGRAVNTASYAPWIAHKPRQAWFHKARGWRTWQDAIVRLGLSTPRVSTRFDVNTSGEKNKLAMSINRVIDKIRKAVA